MPVLLRALAIAAATLVLASCAETTKYDAAGDAHALLLSIRDGDKPAFDAHVDREALKTQIRARVLAAAFRQDRPAELGGFAVLLSSPLVDAFSDRLIQPDVFRAVADYLGYSAQTPIPSRMAITEGLRNLDTGRVCVASSKSGPCLLTFRDEGGTWRLIGFDGDIEMLRPPKF